MVKVLDSKQNFLGIEKQYSTFETSKVVVLPVPYEHTVSYGGGTKKGPDAILKASHFVEFFERKKMKRHCSLFTTPFFTWSSGRNLL